MGEFREHSKTSDDLSEIEKKFFHLTVTGLRFLNSVLENKFLEILSTWMNPYFFHHDIRWTKHISDVGIDVRIVLLLSKVNWMDKFSRGFKFFTVAILGEAALSHSKEEYRSLSFTHFNTVGRTVEQCRLCCHVSFLFVSYIVQFPSYSLFYIFLQKETKQYWVQGWSVLIFVSYFSGRLIDRSSAGFASHHSLLELQCVTKIYR